MGFSPLALMSRRIPDVGRSSPRTAAVSGVGVHHNDGVDSFGMATDSQYQVSAQYWITDGGLLLPNIDENRRAWTSGAVGYPAGAAADHRNVTVEVSNSPQGKASGSYAISDAAMGTLIALIADVYQRYNLGAVRRGADRGVGIHSDWVPTICPGPYINAELPSIIRKAEALRTGGLPTTLEEHDMPMIIRTTNAAPGEPQYFLWTQNGIAPYARNESKALNATRQALKAMNPGAVTDVVMSVYQLRTLRDYTNAAGGRPMFTPDVLAK